MASLFKLGSPVGLKKALLNSIESSASIIGICSTSESCFATARESGICCRPRNFCANHSNPSTKANRQMFRHSPTLPLDSMREVTAINANPDRATAANDTAANDTAANDTAANDQPQLMPGTCILPSINHDGTKRVKVSGLGEKVIDWPRVSPLTGLWGAWIKIPLAHASGKQTAAPLGAEKVAFDTLPHQHSPHGCGVRTGKFQWGRDEVNRRMRDSHQRAINCLAMSTTGSISGAS